MSGILKWLMMIMLAALVAAVGVVAFSSDPAYTLQEWIFARRFHRYNALIEQMARKHGVDPLLIKAVIWQESRFRPEKVGTSGERGLMQITTGAAADWVSANKIETFYPSDLFDPKTNIDAGTWYLKRALDRWSEKKNSIPFALAEYNAGRSRVYRWIEESPARENGKGEELQISFPGTQQYVETVLARYYFYKDRQRM